MKRRTILAAIITLPLFRVRLFSKEKVDPLSCIICEYPQHNVSFTFVPVKGHWGIIEDGEDPDMYYFDDIELVNFYHKL